MVKLALIGKNISHSRSKEIYENLLGQKIQYNLLDYSSISQIPDPKELFYHHRYQGVSITSPYKKHFLNLVKGEGPQLEGINCLYLKEGDIFGINTDFLALKVLLKKVLESQYFSRVIILGDGVMARITQRILKSFDREFEVFSRRKTPFFSRLTFEGDSPILLINTCLRGLVFKGNLPEGSLFYDYNYDNFDQANAGIKKYVDGLEFLRKQAVFSLTYWAL